jgi:general stress protein 13
MYKVGDIVYGKITNIQGYGAFVSLEGYDGLIHISEFSDSFVRNIEEYVKIGQKVKLKIIDVDEEMKQVRLSYKQIHKTRGIKWAVPSFKIGFKPLSTMLPKWIVKAKEEKNK